VDGINNVCPSGWKVPTRDELAAETFTSLEDAFAKMKLTYSGFRGRADGVIANSGFGYYWTSTARPLNVGETRMAAFYSSLGTELGWNVSAADGYVVTDRASAMTVRCIKNY
jgi:uncharacterized protein (TIGR02145 family)